jgi:hypothetical protein
MMPAHYLSRNDIGAWAVIHGGMPLCPDGTLADAIRCAERYKLPVSGPWWDGAVSAWQPASELQASS